MVEGIGAMGPLRMAHVAKLMSAKLRPLDETSQAFYQRRTITLAGEMAVSFSSRGGDIGARWRANFGRYPTDSIKEALLGLLHSSNKEVVLNAMSVCAIERIHEAVPFLTRIVFGQLGERDIDFEIGAASALAKMGKNWAQRYEDEFLALQEFSKMDILRTAGVDNYIVWEIKQNIRRIFQA
ncbi:hypothetical protein HZC35_06905 [Candidatus Saganbacteria bacterium]|nr:hypothetical protein [Candidatus Saganbacteria bacterium]